MSDSLCCLQFGLIMAFFFLSVSATPKLQIEQPPVHISTGAYLRYASASFPVYSEHATIVFPLSFGFAREEYFYRDETLHKCKDAGFKPMCLVARLIFPQLEEVSSRINTLQYSLTGIDVSGVAYPKSQLYGARAHGGSTHYRDMFDDIHEMTGRRRRSAFHKVKRQVALAALAIGNAVGYFLPKWFKTDEQDQVDSKAVYESLAQKVAESHKTVIQLAKAIPLLEQAQQYNMDTITDFFLHKIGRLANNTEKHLESMQTGEMRVALIQANVIQELNRF
jgi:hypothetical protein